jgi:hypothetical protein
VADSTYIVALRRDRRDDAPSDWIDLLRQLEGVSVVGASSRRAQVLADHDGVERLRDAVGPYTHIEPAIEHRRV